MHAITEAERLNYLGHLKILDTAPDPRFDRIAEIARRSFDVPMAAVSLVDAERQWFKAQCGLPFGETSREVAICDHTIRSDSVFVVEDTTLDARFAHGPLVLEPPYVRFYAGAPLSIEPGLRLGALCIMSDRPRRFDEHERSLLKLLAEDACDQLHRHRLQNRLADELERGRERNRLLLSLSEELAHKDRVSQQVYRIGRIGGWEIDLASNALSWSDEVYALLDVERDFSLELDNAMNLISEEYRQTAKDALSRAAETGESFELEAPIRTKSGAMRWMRVLGEKDSKKGRVFGTIQDVTARREIEAELKRVATTDGLTGLPNRNCFMSAVEAALREDALPGASAALLLIDLDDFKEANDMLGHDAGDWLLSVMARRLESSLRNGDIVGRLGGDEFGVLLRGDRSAAEIDNLAKKLLEAATASVRYFDHSMHVGASIGIALFPVDAGDAATLMKRADAALYCVKRLGGDGFQFYTDELGKEAESRATLLREVRAGLTAGQFTVAYQPVVNLRDGTLAGVESLMRWNHPQRGLVPASAFLAALEEPNLGRLLSDAARDIAIAQYAAWRRMGLSLGRLGLNVSAGQLRNAEFTDGLFKSLSAHGLKPWHLVLEITEGILLGRRPENIARRIHTLHDAGVVIALDDFGTGYASLTHLRQFPVDILKIDASFVRSMGSVDASRTIVKTVIDMAHGLGMHSVAEGVEGPELDAVLKLMGCEFGQGYFYGRPMLADDILSYLRSNQPTGRVVPAAHAG
jgi:diguanylate cyclase (GGDEF)-like protein/PAS domain S-box-containing protein